VSPLHQVALRELRASNPHVRDIWVWTQEGGPTRVSPRSLYPFHGFWQLIDADVYVTGRLAWNPDADVAELARAWVRSTFGTDRIAVENLTRLLLASRGAVLDGLYIQPYARGQVRALGLEPPPMLWIFEWDIVTGSSAALSTIYSLSRHDLDAALGGGRNAVSAAREMRQLLDAIPPARVTQPALLHRLGESLRYQEDLFLTLAGYREAVLQHYRWLDTGDGEARRAFRAAAATYHARRDAHVEQYGDNLDFRAYSFFDADAGMRHAERDRVMAWLARWLLLLIVLGVLARATLPALPDRAAAAGGLLLVAAATLTSSWFDSVAVLVVLAVLPGTFLGTLLLQVRRDWRWPLSGAVAAALVVATAVPLLPVAIRGPGYFWFQFWTSDTFRVLLVTGGFAAAGWVAVVAHGALRSACGCGAAGAAGRLMIAYGVPLVCLGALLQGVGLERALTLVNNQLAVLPMGLSVILGITTHLDIPLALPAYLVAAGAVLSLLGFVVRASTSRRDRGRTATRRAGSDAAGHSTTARVAAE
jgi:MFS family permease